MWEEQSKLLFYSSGLYPRNLYKNINCSLLRTKMFQSKKTHENIAQENFNFPTNQLEK